MVHSIALLFISRKLFALHAIANRMACNREDEAAKYHLMY